MQKNVSARLLYSAVCTAVLPFVYAISLLSVQAIEAPFVSSVYKLAPSVFYPASFFILFMAAFVANVLLYAHPAGTFSAVLLFASSFLSSLFLRSYVFTSPTVLFGADLIVALSAVSLVFTMMVLLAAHYSAQLECRVAFILASLCFSFAFALFNFKSSLLCILMSRAFVGFAVGVISKYLSCYLSLIAPLEKRGVFSSLYVFGLVGGLFSFNARLSFYRTFFSKPTWSLPLFFLFYPILLRLCLPLTIENSASGSFLSLLFNPKATRSLFLVAAFHIAQNLCGINQMALNPESIYGKEYGFHAAATLFVGLVVSFFVGYLLEIFGRKAITLVSCFILMLGCVFFYFKIAVIFTAYFFSFGFNLGLGVVPYVILSEIFPVDYISAGAFFGTSCNWIGSALSTIIPQGDMTNPYNVAFVVYFLSTGLFSLAIITLFRETKQQTPAFQ